MNVVKKVFLFITAFLFGASVTRIVTVSRAQVAPATNLVSCVRNGNGNVRIVDGANECRNNEHVVEWQQQPEEGTVFPFVCPNCALDGVTFLAGRNLTGAFLQGAMIGSDVTGTNFTGSNLSSVGFGSGIVDNTNFTNANLSYAVLNNLDLHTSNFTGSSLYFVNMGSANISGLDFSAVTDVTGANFTNTNAQNTNFSNLHFSSVDFTGADTTGASFTGATWHNTLCPDGTNSDNNGYTCVGHF